MTDFRSVSSQEVEEPRSDAGWLVVRKKDIEPWEVARFNRYDEAAMHFDAVAAQWSTVFFCRIAHCEGKPLDVTPVINEFAATIRRLEAERDDLKAAARGILDLHTKLVNSGDCGFWDPEAEPEVQAVRALLDAREK